MSKVRYTGSPAPKTLRDWCDRHPERVYEVSVGGGYVTDNAQGISYDVALRNGWICGPDDLHTIIEGTVAETLNKLREVIPCTCEGCVAGEGYGGETP